MERLSVYLHGPDGDLKALLEERAQDNNRSLSAEVVMLVKFALRLDKEPYVYEVEVEREG